MDTLNNQNMNAELEADTDLFEDVDEQEEGTVGVVCESIETNLWLAEGYFHRGMEGLAIECLRSAWMEYVRFSEVLRVYSGDDLGRRLIRALVDRAGDAALGMAIGPEPEADHLRRALLAA